MKMEENKYLIFSFLRSGVEANSATEHAMPPESTENGERSVLH